MKNFVAFYGITFGDTRAFKLTIELRADNVTAARPIAKDLVRTALFACQSAIEDCGYYLSDTGHNAQPKRLDRRGFSDSLETKRYDTIQIVPVNTRTGNLLFSRSVFQDFTD